MNEETRKETQSLTLRMPNEIIDYIKKKAKRDDRSINYTAAKLLQSIMQTEQNEDPPLESHA